MANPYVKQYLMTAGPTPLPPAVSQVMAEPVLYHRAPAFIEVYARCLARLKGVFRTENEVLCFASSGTGAMESAVANLIAPGQPALVASCGKFGERWRELCDAYGADTVHLDVGWGEKVEPVELDRALAESPGADLVFTTLVETSTGVVCDVAALTEVAHAHGAMMVVDAVSGLGAVPMPQDRWGVDVAVAGSQKALMCPPGLGFVSVSEGALERARERPAGRYYFDWARTAEGQGADPPDSPFTPAITLFRALDVALAMIEDEGLDRVLARHALLGRAARAAARGIGLELLGPEDDEAGAVTALKVPAGLDGSEIVKRMRDRYGVEIPGGQARLKGRIVRIAHCGYFGAFDVLTAFSALEMTLHGLGHELELGAGVAAAERVFAEAAAERPDVPLTPVASPA